jgi:hypothetical protein
MTALLCGTVTLAPNSPLARNPVIAAERSPGATVMAT